MPFQNYSAKKCTRKARVVDESGHSAHNWSMSANRFLNSNHWQQPTILNGRELRVSAKLAVGPQVRFSEILVKAIPQRAYRTGSIGWRYRDTTCEA